MPPSAIFQSLKKAGCRRLLVSTTLNIARAAVTKLNPKAKARTTEFGAATTYVGEGKVKAALSFYLRRADRKNNWTTSLIWFFTEQDPPPDFLAFAEVEPNLAKIFGEREVDVNVEFSFDRNQIVSFFKPIELGDQTQILDEIIGFKGVKRDPKGKNLYTMEITISDTSIELNLYFRQTVRLEQNMVIALLETAGKIAALAIKRKESIVA